MSNYRVHICLKLIEAVSLQVPMPNVEHYLERHIGGGDRPNKAEEKKLQEAMADISKRGLGHDSKSLSTSVSARLESLTSSWDAVPALPPLAGNARDSGSCPATDSQPCARSFGSLV